MNEVFREAVLTLSKTESKLIWRKQKINPWADMKGVTSSLQCGLGVLPRPCLPLRETECWDPWREVNQRVFMDVWNVSCVFLWSHYPHQGQGPAGHSSALSLLPERKLYFLACTRENTILNLKTLSLVCIETSY
jgi:hypothetical protein